MTFIYIVLTIMVACLVGICIWFVIKSHESDAAYEKAIDEIYGAKR